MIHLSLFSKLSSQGRNESIRAQSNVSSNRRLGGLRFSLACIASIFVVLKIFASTYRLISLICMQICSISPERPVTSVWLQINKILSHQRELSDLSWRWCLVCYCSCSLQYVQKGLVQQKDKSLAIHYKRGPENKEESSSWHFGHKTSCG